MYHVTIICLLVTSVSQLQVAKTGLVRRITMHGHLTDPEICRHVSDRWIGTISNSESAL